MSNKVRVAIIGTGGISGNHISGLKSLGDTVEVVGAVDVDRAKAETFCAKHGIARAYGDTGEMLRRERPGLVQICTPPATHASLSIQCMEAGAWVLCEKPMCGSLAELDAVQEAERKTGCYCSSVFQWRFGSGAQHLKRLIDGGTLGKPLVALCNTTWYRDLVYYQVPWRGKWATELGGPTMTHGIHAMDLLLWTMGDFAEVTAATATLDRPLEVEDVSMAIVRFENGAMASIVNSVLCLRQETHVRWDFQKATVEVKQLYSYKNADWQFSVPKDESKKIEGDWQTIGAEIASNHGSQTAAILESMRKGERPLVSGVEARRTLEFITCLYKSAATGKAVRRGSIGEEDAFYRHVAGKGEGK